MSTGRTLSFTLPFLFALFRSIFGLRMSMTIPKILEALQLPSERPVAPIFHENIPSLKVHGKLRILQFNMLADGLSGLRNDLGAFSRAKKDAMMWESRKIRLLHEMLQYEPDVITLQECDHYYDFFLPQLSARGYDGFFAPKPASACLEVHDNSDGCAIFYKRDKLSFVSAETMTYALSKADVMINTQASKAVREEEKQLRTQNQVALILVCDLLSPIGDNQNQDNDESPQVIIATTHLKAAKTALGEQYRLKESQQLLAAIDRSIESVEFSNQFKNLKLDPAVILTGDLNACPTAKSETFGFECTMYSFIKSHPLELRSVLNDDLEEFYKKQGKDSDEEIWTTWKARNKQGKEVVVKHCIDYIMYAPLSSCITRHFDSKTMNYVERRKNVGLRAVGVVEGFREDSVDIGEDLLPNAIYPSDHVAVIADLEIIQKI